MSPWLTFVIGVILGLLVGWIFELFYRRRGEAGADFESAAREPEWAQASRATPAEIAIPVAVAGREAGPAPVEPGQPLETEPLQVEDKPDWPVMTQRVAEVAEMTDEPPIVQPYVAGEAPPSEGGLPPDAVDVLAVSDAERGATPGAGAGARDKLILIEGIGPVYEKKLNEAGIYTFRDLIAAGPERLQDIVQPQSWQRVNFAEWIEQAQLIDEGKDEELKALQARLFRKKT